MKTLQKRQKIRRKSDFDKALAHLGVHLQLQQVAVAVKKPD